jgi:toxin ParE1/3/4
MSRFVISPAADRDIQAILAWTQEQFGTQARSRYRMLVMRAIQDVAENHERPGCHSRPEVSRDAWTYHLRHSRDHVSPPTERVRSPRHFLLYRLDERGRLEISRVLHDRMDPSQHLPEE